MSASTIIKSTTASEIWFDTNKLFVRLDDGREIGIPLNWFPTLLDASEAQRNNWRLIGGGEGIHWEDLDEDILVEGLIK
jgi:hypothetical protein